MHALYRFVLQQCFNLMLSMQSACRLDTAQHPEALDSYTIARTSVSSVIIGSFAGGDQGPGMSVSALALR